jgi:hypothetical protein
VMAYLTVNLHAPTSAKHLSHGSFDTVEFTSGGMTGVTLFFHGSLVTCAADLATVFDIHHHAQDRRPLLEAAMLALDTPSQAHLAALIKAAQDMQDELAEATP